MYNIIWYVKRYDAWVLAQRALRCSKWECQQDTAKIQREGPGRCFSANILAFPINVIYSFWFMQVLQEWWSIVCWALGQVLAAFHCHQDTTLGTSIAVGDEMPRYPRCLVELSGKRNSAMHPKSAKRNNSEFALHSWLQLWRVRAMIIYDNQAVTSGVVMPSLNFECSTGRTHGNMVMPP